MARPKDYQRLRRLLDFYMYAGIALLVVAIVLIIIPLLPYFYYLFNTQATSDEVSTLEQPIAAITPSVTPTPTSEMLPLPQKDPTLSKEGWLKIPKIGVDTKIIESSNAKSALYKGVWRDPQFFNPLTGNPMILAAHRYGYIEWSSSFRRKSSFYNLPRLNKHDKIIVIWDQRQFEYEIYAKKSEKTLSDYTADLVLYTCQYLKSDIRVFIYAKRVK